MSALSTDSQIVSRLASGEYKSTPLPEIIPPPTLNPFQDLQGLKSRDIINEYETTEFFTQSKKVNKLYKRALRDHDKLEKFIDEKSKGKEIAKFNGEYLFGKLEIKKIEILKFEKFFEIQDLYCEIIDIVKEYEDPYKLASEKLEYVSKLEEIFEDFYDLLKQMRFLDVERHKLLKLQKGLNSNIGGLWIKKMIKKINII